MNINLYKWIDNKYANKKISQKEYLKLITILESNNFKIDDSAYFKGFVFNENNEFQLKYNIYHSNNTITISL